MELTLLIIYGLLLLFIFFYSLVQINLVFNYLKFHYKHKETATKTQRHEDTLRNIYEEGKVLNISKEYALNVPFVTIQLPLYNELYVVERLIDAVSALKYPKDRFEIQVLDDSTDETVKIVAKKIQELQQGGGKIPPSGRTMSSGHRASIVGGRGAKNVQIHHIKREKRTGFKAGALAEGLKIAKGEFIAIFDADFIPDKDFLLKTIPYFQNEQTGVVQTRWGHINKDYSLLTKLQAFGLDAHFSVEQTGRNAGGHFINFNGTAGVWRKKCIIDAGGWQSDTLTEDLDLSYRAQLKGWKFKFLENVVSPAELPPTMNALKTQQFRWTKGAAECARKNLWKVLKSAKISLSTKIHAFFHLMNSFIFICIITTAVLSVPLLLIKNNFNEYAGYYRFGVFFMISLVFLMIFYWVSSTKHYDNKLLATLNFILKFPAFLSISMGLSLHNAIAVFEGY
ncbi:MAG: glycosyltransferase, partial [Bacteroidetes bacterium]|nr:glycosyltransferase [Bacteroidota bacterium]